MTHNKKNTSNQKESETSTLIISRNARTWQLDRLDLDTGPLDNPQLPLTHPNRPTGVIALENFPLAAPAAMQALRDRQSKHIRDGERDRRRSRRGTHAETRFLAHGDWGWQQDPEFGRPVCE